MTRTPNQIGEDAETRARKILGGKRVPGSGNGRFLALDFASKVKFVYSVKATDTIRETALRAIGKLWREAEQGARGLGRGHGDGAKPAMIFELEGKLLVLTELEDHAAILTGEIEPYITPTKGAERRAKASANPRDM